ncbi:hypothetical protein M0802_012914 [Mischocyttarus mexicanus]|nr:hypothetical protein M0802_012914 [Mischocyttarus mexicanus]
MEEIRSHRGLLAVGAPSGILRDVFDLVAATGVGDEAYEDYGGAGAVNSIDQRYVSRRRAREFPAVRLGPWNDDAELALTLGLGLFNIKCTEDITQVLAWLDNSGIDRIVRAQHLRKALEVWKRGIAISDTIAFTEKSAVVAAEWPRLLRDSSLPEGFTAWSFARMVVSEYIEYSWNMNIGMSRRGTTLTGLRLPSSAYRSEWNVG